jgi:2-polyprenyl-6-methoxyphenol hydroxylase-like FAD-dependent oxidoreductase
MSLPERTTFLIVGAGPSGLATAISLVHQGCRDVVVVDAVEQGENTSRAFAIHAGTLEVWSLVLMQRFHLNHLSQALDTVGCAEPLVQLGIKATDLVVRNRTSELVAANFDMLKTYTRYPFALILPQDITERELGKRLRELGVSVYRPKKATELRQSGTHESEIDVTFEGGEVVRAKYVIGADGARSIVGAFLFHWIRVL